MSLNQLNTGHEASNFDIVRHLLEGRGKGIRGQGHHMLEGDKATEYLPWVPDILQGSLPQLWQEKSY